MVNSEFAATTSVGSVFQLCGAATAKARLQTVDSLTGGTTRRLALVERSVRRPGKSSTRVSGPKLGASPCRILYTDENFFVNVIYFDHRISWRSGIPYLNSDFNCLFSHAPKWGFGGFDPVNKK